MTPEIQDSTSGGEVQNVDVYWARREGVDLTRQDILSPDKRIRIGAMRCRARAQGFLVGRSLLRRAVGQREGCHPAQVKVSTDSEAQKKPHLPGTEWQISLTYSGPWVGLAIAKNVQVGLDVEVITDDWDTLSVAQLVLSPGEHQKLQDTCDSSRARVFTRIWTRKEAVLKATGRGLFTELGRLNIGDVGGRPTVMSWPPNIDPRRRFP